MFLSSGAIAADYFRLVTDIDGDGKPGTISASIIGSGDFQEYLIKVGNGEYRGQFFAALGDQPKIELARIRYTTGIKQILVTTSEPTYCNYTILSYINGKLVRLLEHPSHQCDAPKFLGNGKIEVHTWEGFWDRKDRLDLSENGLKLTRDSGFIYPVGVKGVGKNLLELKPAGCKTKSISEGEAVVVNKYDAQKKRYLIHSSREACGWITKDNIFDAVGGLPWAD